ncbi:PHP domain-containing protein [Ornithinimicrobium tianjinense]|uniref:PHP domain-containing protein n=1 Tax=Ornithinimicrobium tianjinense TaxID=1195761 RepID=UPI0016632F58|nr:PHP domain-containing protein [Ornithinimicrobium tianjinense]
MSAVPPQAVVDLHTHSLRSDGRETPAEVVAAAAAAGVDVIALTDHDVYSGWAEADVAGTRLGVTVVPGVEVSCRWRGISVHLLGYLPDPTHRGLLAELEESRASRDTRLRRMVDLLAAEGYPISYEEVLQEAGPDATLGRPHVADVLVRNGVLADRSAAFETLLVPGSPFYVSHYAPDPVRATELVVAAGGVPVMAHPFASTRGRVVEESLIEEMAQAGLAGLEVDHRDHGPAEHARAERTATRLGLLRTGSSDYHGSGKPNRLAENTTRPEVLEQILERGSGTPLLGAPLGARRRA